MRGANSIQFNSIQFNSIQFNSIQLNIIQLRQHLVIIFHKVNTQTAPSKWLIPASKWHDQTKPTQFIPLKRPTHNKNYKNKKKKKKKSLFLQIFVWWGSIVRGDPSVNFELISRWMKPETTTKTTQFEWAMASHTHTHITHNTPTHWHTGHNTHTHTHMCTSLARSVSRSISSSILSFSLLSIGDEDGGRREKSGEVY